jgi:hypothetical protein
MDEFRTRLASDGLPARLIKPHTLEKYDRRRKYCSILNRGMRYLWPENRGYLELFAGPGMAIDEELEEEVDACPLTAATGVIDSGFSRLAFVEIDRDLVGALEERLRRRGVGPDRALVIAGDVNDRDVLARALEFLPDPGLVFTFVDPEDINFEWASVRECPLSGVPPSRA